MDEVVLVEAVGATRIVTINRPQARNALTRAVLTQARRALDEASSDPAIRCVVLCGAEGHFCSGADLRQNLIDDPELTDHLDVYMDEFHGLVKSVVRCDKPTIAMMDGGAVGFGADLAFACDLRVASTRAYAQEKFVKIGLLPDGGGTFWLPRLVGTARAMQMILLADKVEAEELH
jgi:2-(1,2-epoxy-1,2-dihydrophenyl)acetyl-CoA isomerase